MTYILMALFTFRTWQFLANDIILDNPREWFFEHTPQWVTTLVTCPWCLGFWLSGISTGVLIVILNYTEYPWWLIWGSMSAIVGLLGSRSE